MYDKQLGMGTTKRAYDLIFFEHQTIMANDFLLKIWHLNIPQNLKCFIWLICNMNINTWDTLCKKGWHGPNRCCLCKGDAKTMEHLFVGYPFCKKLIQDINCLFDVHLLWSAPTLMENLINWVSKGGTLQYLPLFLIWNIWKARNRNLFDDLTPNIVSLLTYHHGRGKFLQRSAKV